MSLNLPPTTPLSLGFASAYEKVLKRTPGGNVPSVPSVPLVTSAGTDYNSDYAKSYSDYATKKAYSRIADDKKAREMKLTGYYPSKLTNIFNSGATGSGLSGGGAFTNRSKVTSLIQNLLSERATQLNNVETPIDTGINRIGMAPKSASFSPSEASGYFDTLYFLIEKLKIQLDQGYFTSVFFEDLTKVWKILSTYGFLLDKYQLESLKDILEEILSETDNIQETFKSKAPLIITYAQMIDDLIDGLIKISNKSIEERELALTGLSSDIRRVLKEKTDKKKKEGRGRKSYRQ